VSNMSAVTIVSEIQAREIHKGRFIDAMGRPPFSRALSLTGIEQRTREASGLRKALPESMYARDRMGDVH
jgi:hypothetical protein